MGPHIFDRSGFAALSDLKTHTWRDIYERLKQAQTEFLARSRDFRSPEYIWPRDPLRTWSRLWEYPYVYHHLHRLGSDRPKNKPLKVADVGSGVTFFPFALSRLGCDVSCVDVDPVCERDLNAAIGVVPHGPGQLCFVRTDGQNLSFEDASLDAVYSISVLEHVPNFEQIIREIHRVLKPSGRLVLTFDVDYRGDSQLTVESFAKAMTVLDDLFEHASPERPVHPKNILHSLNSPYALKTDSLLMALRKAIVRRLRGRKSPGKHPRHLAIYAACLTPRSK
ncbi:MAG: class I SAM-dependent methyltransferase [Steroidobacteraceae bacterium]|nr:class I SAM-dependent methyltransferase [Steroidobacteraceae bacterium]